MDYNGMYNRVSYYRQVIHLAPWFSTWYAVSYLGLYTLHQVIDYSGARLF